MTIKPVTLNYVPLVWAISLKLWRAAYEILYRWEVRLSISFLSHPFFCIFSLIRLYKSVPFLKLFWKKVPNLKIAHFLDFFVYFINAIDVNFPISRSWFKTPVSHLSFRLFSIFVCNTNSLFKLMSSNLRSLRKVR